MIDLDELLHGNPTFAQVAEFWKEDGDFCEESYQVQAMERWLVTKEQRQSLCDHELSIEKIMNGRYVPTEKNNKLIRSLFDAWNTKLGYKAFYL